ncbi:MAG TPA: hypothetical protein VGK27_03715 [Candidatus Deferrimicrobiaceae bacterium]|jgi:hypothetical protein
MKASRFDRYPVVLCLALLSLLAACGGGDNGGLFDGLNSDTKTIYAYSYADNTHYPTTINKVGEGAHCYLYVEAGRTIDNSTRNELITGFDNLIYPRVTSFFGSEPNPGADGDPKIYIVLLHIPQSPTSPTGVGGYFDPVNEYPRRGTNPFSPISNQKEMYFADIDDVRQDIPYALRTMAHEFQHMIHWEQKDHLALGLTGSDDIWLNEAMSVAAEIYCYGIYPPRISIYANSTGNALTLWSPQTDRRDYAKVAMWTQYIIDRVSFAEVPDNNVFRKALHSTLVGQASIDNALIGTGKTFVDVFVDWTIANTISGINPVLSVAGHPEWSYRWSHYQGNAASLSNLGNIFWADNVTFAPLPRWSSTYALYTPLGGAAGGSVTWVPSATQTSATLIDMGRGVLVPLVPNTQYDYLGEAFLCIRNASVLDTIGIVGDNVVSAAPAAGSLSRSRSVGRAIPMDVPPPPPGSGCGTLQLLENERRLRTPGIRVDF